MADAATTRPKVTIAPLGQDRKDDLLAVDQWAFAFDTEGLDPGPELEAMEWDRTWGAWLPGRDDEPDLSAAPAGVGTVYSLRMPVPGAQVPAAGLSWIGVHPQHRRKGVLSAMIRHHLHSVHDLGRESVSALFASEPGIYGRFGYGLASRSVTMTLDRGAELRDVPGAQDLVLRMEHASMEQHTELVDRVFEVARARRPGMVSRESPGLKQRPLVDPPKWRDGAESLRILVCEDAAGDVRGYALFRRKSRWEDSGADGTVTVRELVALDAAAARALWGRLSDLDLMARVKTDDRPTDDPLLHLLVDPRSAQPKLGDALWVRLVDVPAALSARRYSTEVDVVLEVTDAQCPWNAGRWHLVAGTGATGGGSCERTQAPSDLALDVRELGSAWLGGITLDALHAAGQVDERTPGCLHQASVALSWPVAPYCGWMF